MNGRLVGAPRLRISRAKRHVHGPANLLIEENVLGECRDVGVRPERQLAERASARVGIEGLQQIPLAATRRRIDDKPAFESQADVMDLPTIDHHRERKADVPLGRVFDRTGEDFPIGEVILSHRS